MKEFKGRVAVVTGAASGIGRGLAERFAREGMRVVMADVDEESLNRSAREIGAAGGEVLAVRTDVSRLDDVRLLAEKTLERFGGVHIVCNNAGVGGVPGTWESTEVDWEWTLGVNLWGVIHGVRAFIPIMLERGEEGHIVNTASVAGLIAGAGGPAYTVSKFGVVALSESLYYELQAAAHGRIKVSVLCPALTNTRILESGRLHPSGPQPAPPAGTPEAAMFEMLKGIFATGMDPSETAGHVIDAIANERFYILTHPEHNAVIEARVRAIVNGDPPPTLMPG
jgi:NAD(P)-dependent dehydrogenase (short-subunit alcohol dehydrogenase family)